MEELTVDVAVAEFQKLIRAEMDRRGLLHTEAAAPKEEPTDREAYRWRVAESLLRRACGDDAARCSDLRCRRRGACRNLAGLAARRSRSAHGPRRTRRPASVEALRHAMWVWMTALANSDDPRRVLGGASGSRPTSARADARAGPG
ncbi:MAG: hypothetical protein ACKVP3_13500 [Hyphomicrobiaceae bacterium]